MRADTALLICRLRADGASLTERVFRRGVGRDPVIPGPPPSRSKRRLAAQAADARCEAAELDLTGFADLCADAAGRPVRELARLVRARAGAGRGWTVDSWRTVATVILLR